MKNSPFICIQKNKKKRKRSYFPANRTKITRNAIRNEGNRIVYAYANEISKRTYTQKSYILFHGLKISDFHHGSLCRKVDRACSRQSHQQREHACTPWCRLIPRILPPLEAGAWRVGIGTRVNLRAYSQILGDQSERQRKSECVYVCIRVCVCEVIEWRKKRERGSQVRKVTRRIFPGIRVWLATSRIHRDFRFSVNSGVDDRTTCEVFQRRRQSERIRNVYTASESRMRIFNFCGKATCSTDIATGLFRGSCRSSGRHCFLVGSA